MRRASKEIRIGKIKIGGNNPIAIQGMTNTLTREIDKTIEQIKRLEEAGCEIVRVSVPDIESVNSLKEIKKNISIPLVADIHFDYKLAIASAKYADKIRINPGNIGSQEKIKEVVKAAKNYGIPIRIGINLGSLEKEIETKFGLTAEALVESALRSIKLLEENNFYDIVVSLKSSDVLKTIKAYELIAPLVDYPLHLGITEAGSSLTGTIKSSIGIGSLLAQGIGDTIRVSLSAEPTEEIRVAKKILEALHLRHFSIEIVSCPTCARANIDVIRITKELEEKTESIKKNIRIAIMGCSVNGPGEAEESDIGIVGTKNDCLFYKNGKLLKKIEKTEILSNILDEIRNIRKK